MKQKNYHSCTVGQIVAGNFDTTKVFSRYHIDFAAMAILVCRSLPEPWY